MFLTAAECVVKFLRDSAGCTEEESELSTCMLHACTLELYTYSEDVWSILDCFLNSCFSYVRADASATSASAPNPWPAFFCARFLFPLAHSIRLSRATFDAMNNLLKKTNLIKNGDNFTHKLNTYDVSHMDRAVSLPLYSVPSLGSLKCTEHIEALLSWYMYCHDTSISILSDNIWKSTPIGDSIWSVRCMERLLGTF